MQNLIAIIQTKADERIEGPCMVLADYAIGVKTGRGVRIVFRHEMKRMLFRSIARKG